MSTSMVVNVADLVRRPGSRRHAHREGHLEALKVVATEVPGDATVSVDATLESLPQGIVASGVISAPWRADCRRCLRPVDGEAVVPFRELYEEDATEGDSYPLKGDMLDLEPLAREAVLVELPWAPLCMPDCRGLCPDCGADLNTSPCGCRRSGGDERWAALDVLRPQIEG